MYSYLFLQRLRRRQENERNVRIGLDYQPGCEEDQVCKQRYGNERRLEIVASLHGNGLRHVFDGVCVGYHIFILA